MRILLLLLLSLPGTFTIAAEIPDAVEAKPKTDMKQAAMLLTGNGVPQDVEAAIAIYESAAETGLTFAQYKLGRIYLDAEFVRPQPDKAFAWLLRAARAGYLDAQIELSRLFAEGLGVEASDVDAHKWLNLAESLGATGLEERMTELEERMSFSERVQARYLANRCKMREYENC